ncbi:hypothetical protein [Nannocystis pusilla]|uniref:hypothetical protein n=1 Tax=Nannocystis pusilla TaxID=889268 RepID=UPI003B75F746
MLTGFPTTPAGEIGVFAFMIGQGFGSSSAILWSSAVIYSLLMPLHVPGCGTTSASGCAWRRRPSRCSRRGSRTC